mgnify:CR=1 FL=1
MSLYVIEREKPLNKRIIELCEKANYIVRVCKISTDNGGGKVLTTFPNREFGHPIYSREELIHEIEKKENYFKVRRYDKHKWRTFNIPNYAVRTFIMQDIYLKCGFLGLDQELVIGYDGNKPVKRLIDAIPEPEGVDKQIELSCATLFVKRNMGYDVSKESNYTLIEPGMKFIEKFMRDSAEKFLNEEILE